MPVRNGIKDTGASGAATGQPYVFVFQPGGVAGGNVFTTWATLYAALNAIVGPRLLAFNNSIVSPCVVPAGVWNMLEVTWVSDTGAASLTSNLAGNIPVVSVTEGASFTTLRHISGVEVQWGGLTPPVADFVGGVGGPDVFVFDQGAILDTVGSTGPFILQNNAVATPILSLRNGSSIFTVAPDAALVDLSVAGSLYVECAVGSVLNPDSVSGIAGSNLFLDPIASSAVTSETQTAMLGTIIFGSIAFGTPLVRYVTRPSLLADGSQAPTTVGLTAVSNDIVRCDPSGGGFAITLPLAFDLRGQTIIVKNVTASANIIAVTPTAPDTIDGAAVFNLAVAFGSVMLVSDGISDWMIV